MKRAVTPLKVIARAPFQVYFEGDADAVSAINPVGPFDVLPGHADFFSMLIPGEVIIEPAPTATDSDGKQLEPIVFNITNGIITVRDDEVLLFVNM